MAAARSPPASEPAIYNSSCYTEICIKELDHVGSPQAGPGVAAVLSVVERCHRLRTPTPRLRRQRPAGLADTLCGVSPGSRSQPGCKITSVTILQYDCTAVKRLFGRVYNDQVYLLSFARSFGRLNRTEEGCGSDGVMESPESDTAVPRAFHKTLELKKRFPDY